MAPNSRPPLTSRIRASFEGRRKSFEGTRKLSKSDSEVSSPLHTNGFIAQDPESIRNAVDQAINGEAFQTAIAANLAKLIKPSIKSALDTIQPVVEAVYSHELLLRKTNQSVEDVLSRMDTNAETAAARRMSFIDSTYVAPGSPADGDKSADAVEGAMTSRDPGGPYFEQFKQLLEEHNAKTVAMISEALESNTTKIAELAQGVSDINESIGPTKESIDSLKSTSEQAATTSSVLQAQLDQLKVDIGQIIEAIGADLGKNIQAIREKPGAPDADLLSSQTTKLDLISTDLAALKGHADTVEKIEAISAELEALKTSVEAGNAANTDGFTNVLAAVEQHATVLTEIKEKEAHPDILAALQQSNDSHALHTSTLLEMKERSLGPVPAPVVSESGSVDHSPALQTIQADLIALKENIAAGLTTNTDLGVKINTVLTTIENHKSGDPAMEILAAVKQCNESHVAHAAALEGLKPGSADSLASASPADGTDALALETKIGAVIITLENEIKLASTTHADALEDIRSPGISAIPDAETNNLAALEIQIGSIISTLETHSAAWNEIKARPDPTATAVMPTDSGSESGKPEGPFATIIETLMLHTNILNEIKEDVSAEILTALHDMGQVQANQTNLLSEIREADLDDEILTLLHASSESHSNHSSALDKIYAAVLIKSRSIDSTAPSGEAPDLSHLKEKISSITEKLEEYNVTLSSIKEATDSSNDSHAAHATALDEIKSRFVDAPADGNNIDTTDLSALEAHVTSIINTLESQSTTLSSIKEGTATTTPEILAAVQVSHDLLTSHGLLLESIKEGSSHADILSNISELKSILEDSKAEAASHGALVKDLHTETKDSHSNLASAIGALALGGAAGAGATALLTKDDDSSSAILDEVKAVRALVSTSATNIDETKEKVSSLTSQIEINHTTITTSISTLGDEIKSEIDASGTGIVESITALDSTVSAMEISPLPALSASLEQHGAALKSLSAQIETIDDNLKENTTQITTLHNGVHLNDTGVEQLKDHVVSRSVTKEPTTIPEGAWFGSARSGSRSPTLSRVVSRSFVEPVYEVVKEVAPSAEEVVAEPALEPESLIDEEPTSKEIQVVENLPKSEEIVGVASLPDEPLAVDEAIVEPGSEALVEEESVPQEVEVTEDLLKVEESAEAFSPPEEPLVVHESATDPETMDEVVDDIQPSTEELAVEPEILIGDQLVSKEIDVPAAAANLPGVEEVTGTDSLPQDPVAIDNVQPSTEESIVELVETVLVDESAAPHSIAEELTVPLVDTEPEVHIPSGNSNELEIPKTKDEPSTDDIASVESSLTKSESALAEEPIVTEPLVGDNAEDTPMNLSDPPKELGLANDGRETCSGQSSALASPASPVFSEGGTMVEKTSGKKKKGKKEKKEKGGGKKGKKEKVPFEMEGEDAE
ncbi:hypothetical protein BKA65DRAFT_411982 [Rhexocercosporidium sp. MPI-PUGE-AT-0058]|nr:hypothetical protein BKA65DRAFT_411982 [Rhexocercosporidium sp. MPI-PUGE-AT-0058]